MNHGNLMCRCVCGHTKGAHTVTRCDRDGCGCAAFVHNATSDTTCDAAYRNSDAGKLMARAANLTANALDIARIS